MSSKAQKLRAKRKAQMGRPIKQGVARTDSGHISRAKDGGDPPDKVAREARMRLFKVSEAVASTPQAATFMGRLSLLGHKGGGISADQYDALLRFTNDRERYMKSIMAPDSLVNATGGPSPSDEESDAASRIKAKERYDAAKKAIQTAQNENPCSNMWAAVEHIVIKNMDFPHMIGDLRLVGNALDRHYRGLDRNRKSA